MKMVCFVSRYEQVIAFEKFARAAGYRGSPTYNGLPPWRRSGVLFVGCTSWQTVVVVHRLGTSYIQGGCDPARVFLSYSAFLLALKVFADLATA